ncbi:hypothetical protein KM043_011569 [Ampulex compressa]|nr:hypothetical protein KM043_011569 [Ampulex compressa]
MRLVLLSIVFTVTGAELCIRLLKNYEETRIARKIPGRLWRWNEITQNFEELEALKLNDSAICSVNIADNLRGKTIVVAADNMNPYIMRNANNTGVTGFIGDVWTTLEETLKFKTIYRTAGPSASQTLMNGQAHALLVATVIYSYTSGYYTYSTPIASNSYALFVQSEGTRVSKWWYASIFSRGLWLTSFIFLVCITATIMGIYYIKRIVCANYVECDNELSSPSFDLLFVLGGISGQGFQKIPVSWSLRLIILSYLIMGMLLSCGFSSTLTSYLAIRGNSIPLSSLQDMVQKRTHSLCLRNDSGAYIHFTVNGSPQGELQPEWKDLVNKGCPDMRDPIALISKLCQPGFAYLEVPDVFLPIYQRVRHKCRIVQTPDAYWSVRLAFLHARSAEHRRLIDVYLMRLRSAGILKYLEKKWISKENGASTNHQWSTFQPVEYAHIHLASLGLFVMMIVSALICVLENIWHRLQTRLRKIRPTPIVIKASDTGRSIIKSGLVLNNTAKIHHLSRNITLHANRW